MTRREFPTAVRAAVIKRAMSDVGFIRCESCHELAGKNWQLDHVRPDGLLGEPTLDNAMLICAVCWGKKNPEDAANIARAKRKEAAYLGAKRRPKRKLQSGDSLKSEERPVHEGREPSVGLSEIARRWGIK